MVGAEVGLCVVEAAVGELVLRSGMPDMFKVQLKKGECFFMRGEVIRHGVNDVLDGRRAVLYVSKAISLRGAGASYLDKPVAF